MTISYIAVRTENQINVLADLAQEIWREYWPAIIGSAQTEYMIEKFQSNAAISNDIADHGYEYWFVCFQDDDERQKVYDKPKRSDICSVPRIIGYTGGCSKTETERYFISKIYLKKDERGKGFAGRIIDFYERLCQARRLHAMFLTVNKNNELALKAYKANGFEIIDAVETDIGKGFIMNDYIMEKQIVFRK